MALSQGSWCQHRDASKGAAKDTESIEAGRHVGLPCLLIYVDHSQDFGASKTLF
jgi:hypothetical protein